MNTRRQLDDRWWLKGGEHARAASFYACGDRMPAESLSLRSLPLESLGIELEARLAELALAAWQVTGAAQREETLRLEGNATERVEGHLDAIRAIEVEAYRLAEELHVTLQRIVVLPDWSHEYDASGQVIFQIAVENADRRFPYWSALATAIDELSLPDDERAWVLDNVSLEVRA